MLTDAEVYVMIDTLGGVGNALSSANSGNLRKLYEQLRLELIFDGDARTAEVTIRPSGGIVRVSEGGLAHKPAGAMCAVEGVCALRHLLHLETR